MWLDFLESTKSSRSDEVECTNATVKSCPTYKTPQHYATNNDDERGSTGYFETNNDEPGATGSPAQVP
ncbi:hypothetical protein F443_03947 [Phytophthora nicotianae P1569]|uniref:Uncharacterized protein n=1 Tax=Phytophthora nicotianae P1569 TaxID=1317065 RepID=V9FRM6_PHYNI|nr:hypothetical protein F443_03947 [Phytophthora nicotianae P1569]